MSEEEKVLNPYHKARFGYLKVYTMNDAWRNAWDSASNEEKELLYALPNFDADVFLKISGIDVKEELAEEMTMEQVCKALGKNVKIVK